LIFFDGGLKIGGNHELFRSNWANLLLKKEENELSKIEENCKIPHLSLEWRKSRFQFQTPRLVCSSSSNVAVALVTKSLVAFLEKQQLPSLKPK
jgi:hypothetical protein